MWKFHNKLHTYISLHDVQIYTPTLSSLAVVRLDLTAVDRAHNNTNNNNIDTICNCRSWKSNYLGLIQSFCFNLGAWIKRKRALPNRKSSLGVCYEWKEQCGSKQMPQWNEATAYPSTNLLARIWLFNCTHHSMQCTTLMCLNNGRWVLKVSSKKTLLYSQ